MSNRSLKIVVSKSLEVTDTIKRLAVRQTTTIEAVTTLDLVGSGQEDVHEHG